MRNGKPNVGGTVFAVIDAENTTNQPSREPTPGPISGISIGPPGSSGSKVMMPLWPAKIVDFG